MSYRALITVWFDQDHQEGRWQGGRVDYYALLGDDLSGGEDIAHHLKDLMISLYQHPEADQIDVARDHISRVLEGPVKGHRVFALEAPSLLDRATWAETWADQEWNVYVDQRKDGRVVWMVRGIDASGRQIHRSASFKAGG